MLEHLFWSGEDGGQGAERRGREEVDLVEQDRPALLQSLLEGVAPVLAGPRDARDVLPEELLEGRAELAVDDEPLLVQEAEPHRRLPGGRRPLEDHGEISEIS